MAGEGAKRLAVLGLPVDCVDADDVQAFIEATVATGRKAVVSHLNIQGANLAVKHSWLGDFFRAAELVFCDGDGVRLGLKMSGHVPPPKITYNEWLWQLATFCECKGRSLYLLGGKPGVATEAAQRLAQRCPQLKIAGTQDGYFDKQGQQNRAVVERINESKPDILLVCMGMPLQERWIADNWGDLDVHVALPGGAALDYASGRLEKAPPWMIRVHLEWLYRLFQEPRRLFLRYVIGNPLFIWRVMRERLR